MQVRRIRVQIETPRLRIVGVVQLPTEGYRSRTTDFLNAHETGFIPLTDAEVVHHDGDGDGASRHDFTAVGTRHIVALMELEDLGVIDDEQGPSLPSLGAVSVAPPAGPNPLGPPPGSSAV